MRGTLINRNYSIHHVEYNRRRDRAWARGLSRRQVIVRRRPIYVLSKSIHTHEELNSSQYYDGFIVLI